MYNRSLNNQKWKSWLKGRLAGAEKPVRLVVHSHSHGDHVQMGVIVLAHPPRYPGHAYGASIP